MQLYLSMLYVYTRNRILHKPPYVHFVVEYIRTIHVHRYCFTDIKPYVFVPTIFIHSILYGIACGFF